MHTSLTNSASEYAVGIDIGTTSISLSVIDLTKKAPAAYRTVKNAFVLPTDESDLFLQDPEGIFDAAVLLLSDILAEFPTTRVIGLTGQMHGILYTDENGRAVSPLFTWRDRRADRMHQTGVSYCDALCRVTGMHIPAGYGMATHFYNVENRLVPKEARSLCTVMDYVAHRLTDRREILMHASNAASIGLFDPAACALRTDLFRRFDSTLTLPAVTSAPTVIGTYRGIPVSVAIGDNQASFLGSVKDPGGSILVNIGTGSQISAVSPFRSVNGDTECRPLFGDDFLLCGSALSGGASYALAERFFSEYAAACGIETDSQYEIMNRLAENALRSGQPPLDVDTRFSGTRSDPTVRGAIRGIDSGNFTPGQLLLGILDGMCRELYELFPKELLNEKHTLVASGNAVQRIQVLRERMETIFSKPVLLSKTKEEAATGSALLACLSAHLLGDVSAFSDFITLRPSLAQASDHTI